MESIAESKKAAEFAQRYGMKNPDSFARQFLAGETLDAAMAEIKRFNDSGIGCSTTLLGESVSERSEAGTARDVNLDLLERIHESGATPWESHISVQAYPAWSQHKQGLLHGHYCSDHEKGPGI